MFQVHITWVEKLVFHVTYFMFMFSDMKTTAVIFKVEKYTVISRYMYILIPSQPSAKQKELQART